MVNIIIQFPKNNGGRKDPQEIKIRSIAVAVFLLSLCLIVQQFSASTRPKLPTHTAIEFGEVEACLFKKSHLLDITSSLTNNNNLTTSLAQTLSTPMSMSMSMQMQMQPELKPKLKPKQKTLHILQGLMGANPAFIAEWEVSLKSLLMNAPLDDPMHIHYVADLTATEAIKKIIEDKAKLKDTLWRTPITISVYSISPEINEVWTDFILEKIRGKSMNNRVKLGGYYRLLAYNVIVDHYYNRTSSTTIYTNNGTESRTVNIRMPQTQRNNNNNNNNNTNSDAAKDDMDSDPPICAIYMDVDIVILANMNPLLQQIDSKYLMQAAMSKGLNSGFLMINMNQFDEFWDLIDAIPDLRSGDDQFMIGQIQNRHRDRVGRLSLPWDVHLAHGWRSHPHDLLEHQPEGVDMLHFAAIRSDHVSFFNENKEQGMDYMCNREEACKGNETKLEQFRSSWGLAEYFVRIPWSWLVHQYGENKLPRKDGSNDGEDDDTEEGLNGFPLRIEYVNV